MLQVWPPREAAECRSALEVHALRQTGINEAAATTAATKKAFSKEF